VEKVAVTAVSDIDQRFGIPPSSPMPRPPPYYLPHKCDRETLSRCAELGDICGTFPPMPETFPPDVILPSPLLLPLGPLSPLQDDDADEDHISDVMSDLSSDWEQPEDESDLEARIDDIIAEEDAEISATTSCTVRSLVPSTSSVQLPQRHLSQIVGNVIAAAIVSTDLDDIDDDELHELLGV
jgi:hypothetical protein